MHEATRRILSVLLRTLEGFEKRSNAILIAATNRKQDLDAALISRFDVSVPFPLPDEDARGKIFSCYAKQLADDEIIAYCLIDEPYDKAGAYAIQGKAAKFVEYISGSYTNVVGLPLLEVSQLLKRANL